MPNHKNQTKIIQHDWQRFVKRPLTFFARPVVGPLMFGLTAGGIPLSAVFIPLGGRIISAELLHFIVKLTPAAVVMTWVGTILGGHKDWKHLWLNALLTSLAACVPLPTAMCVSLALWWGYPAFSGENFPILIAIFVLWSALVSLLGWLVALAHVFL